MCYCVTLELDSSHTIRADTTCTFGPAISPPRGINQTASLTRLPTEILVQIAHSLNDHASLARLGRTNRRLCSILTPLIYAKFSTSFGKETRFLRTLISEPHHLGNLVKHLDWIDRFDNWDADKKSYEREDRKAVATKLFALPSLFHKHLAISVEHAMGGTLHVAFLAAAMSMTPNLETLSATLSTSNSSRIRWNETIWIGAPHAFTHLHTIKLHLRRSSGIDLNPLFLLPAIRTLDMTHVDRLLTDPQKTIWLPLPERCSPVTTLLLRESNIATDILVAAVKSCRNLGTFLYQHNSKWSELQTLDMVLLSSALLAHGPSLRHVGVMDRIETGDSDEESPDNDGVVQDLYEMPALENVLLPLRRGDNIVQGSNTATLKVPPGVRWFSRTVRCGESREVVEGFLALCSRSAKQVKQENPLLQRVTLWLASKESDSSLVACMAKQALKKEGIQLDVQVLEKKSDVTTAVADWEGYIGRT